jgi:hypothetical protein
MNPRRWRRSPSRFKCCSTRYSTVSEVKVAGMKLSATSARSAAGSRVSRGTSLSTAPEPLPQALACHIGHGEPEPPGPFARVVHAEDVGVLQPGRGPDLPPEPLRAQQVGQLGVEHLERHRPLVPEVPRQVHRGHAAPAQLPLDGVTLGEHRCQAVQGGLVREGGRWGKGHARASTRRGPGEAVEREQAGELRGSPAYRPAEGWIQDSPQDLRMSGFHPASGASPQRPWPAGRRSRREVLEECLTVKQGTDHP